MWFWFSIAALLCWSGSDLFSKIGCQDYKDRYSHLKMLGAVGIVMGIHAAYEIFICDVNLTAAVLLTYLPVSLLYIASMAIGYLGLRYIELSISSPICNSSGALVAIMSVALIGLKDIPPAAFIAVGFVSVGVIGLGITEATEDDELRKLRQDASNHCYTKSWAAIAIPIIYCVLDAFGTFADSRVLTILDESEANCAYEITFFLVGLSSILYVLLVKKQKFTFKIEVPKYVGAVFETAGQFFYIYALADEKHVTFAAPIISSYCVASVIWGRVFLKEKLSAKHYVCIFIVLIGIIILGILDM